MQALTNRADRVSDRNLWIVYLALQVPREDSDACRNEAAPTTRDGTQWRERESGSGLTVGYAILPADRAYPVITARLARARHITLAASVTLAAAAIFLTTWAGSRDAQVALQCASSVAIWSAIAVVSTRLWGRAFGWILPLASIGIILFWGRSADHVPRWFNWSDVAAPSHNWWITLAITAAAAMLATSLTRWRRSGLMPTHRSQTRQRRKAVRQILTGPSRTPVHSDRNGIQSD